MVQRCIPRAPTVHRMQNHLDVSRLHVLTLFSEAEMEAEFKVTALGIECRLCDLTVYCDGDLCGKSERCEL